MRLKPRYVRMDRDDLAWENSDKEVESWERSLHNAETYRAVARLILRYRPGEAKELHTPIQGGYNIAFRLQFKDGSSALMRIPRKGIVRFPEEKISYEVATMRYVAANTTIPVPRIYHHGTGAENPTGLGPFIIMDYIDHERTMSDALKDPLLTHDEPHSLDDNISEPKLRFLYGQMANILLQLSTLSFTQIGSLVQDKNGLNSTSGRPLIQNMNSLVEFAGVPPKLLPSQPFTTSKQWYSAMADMHMLQITLQRNDAILDGEDARDKHPLFSQSRVLMDGKNVVNTMDRSSQTAFLPVEDPVCNYLASRMRSLLGNVQHEHVEPLQLVKYANHGDRYRLHTDWSEALQNTTRNPHGGSRQTRRLGSIFIYLADDCQGGETYFPFVAGVSNAADDEKYAVAENGEGLLVRPKKGSGIFWNNLHANGSGDIRVTHAGLPVLSGVKIGLNIWSSYFLDSPIVGA
ncbi:hypothetical protein MY8738_002219 [Beauveria namnaoensis]